MSHLARSVAAHPIPQKPYDAITFVRMNGTTPIYRVAGDQRDLGALRALKCAFERYGAHCFHCKTWMPPQPLSRQCTRDHIAARSEGGGDQLHNLVVSCGPCNRAKGRANLIAFNPEAGVEYLMALARHLDRCVAALSDPPRTA